MILTTTVYIFFYSSIFPIPITIFLCLIYRLLGFGPLNGLLVLGPGRSGLRPNIKYSSVGATEKSLENEVSCKLQFTRLKLLTELHGKKVNESWGLILCSETKPQKNSPHDTFCWVSPQEGYQDLNNLIWLVSDDGSFHSNQAQVTWDSKHGWKTEPVTQVGCSSLLLGRLSVTTISTLKS